MDIEYKIPMPEGLSKSGIPCPKCGTIKWQNERGLIPCVECQREESILVGTIHFMRERIRINEKKPKEVTDEWQAAHDREDEKIAKIRIGIEAEIAAKGFSFDYIYGKAMKELEKINGGAQ